MILGMVTGIDLSWWIYAVAGSVLFITPAGVIWAVLCALARASPRR